MYKEIATHGYEYNNIRDHSFQDLYDNKVLFSDYGVKVRNKAPESASLEFTAASERPVSSRFGPLA